MSHVARWSSLGRAAAGLALVAACAAVTLGSPGGAAAGTGFDLVVKDPDRPPVELVRPKQSTRFATGNLHAAPFVTTAGRPLEIWAHRLAPDGPVVVESIERSSGRPVATPVPGLEARLDQGLSDFLSYRIKDSKGKVVAESTESLCPNGNNSPQGYPSRGSARSSGTKKRPRPVLPAWWGRISFCGEEQADSLVWLTGPGNPLAYFGAPAIALPDGEYTYEATVNPDGILPEKTLTNNHFRARFNLVTDRQLWRDLSFRPDSRGEGRIARTSRSSALGDSGRADLRPPRASQIAGPDGALPDPVALPASRFEFIRQGSRDRISFSSIVSNTGSAPIALFGRRRDRESRAMPGWQYTKAADGRLEKRATNGFVWDARDTHRHWHYNKLAVYELLDPGGAVLRRSDKVGFCFMPTTLLRFLPVPGRVGLGAPTWYEDRDQPVDCGRRNSRRVAMSLPVGWGDEYYQGIAGQSLDVTELPAGTYRLRITVNPEGDLAELDTANNVSERLIELGGNGPNRTLTVPRQGIVSPEFRKLWNPKSRPRGGPGFASVSSGGSIGLGGPAAGGTRLLCGLRGA